MRRKRDTRATDRGRVGPVGPETGVPSASAREEVRIARDHGSADATQFWRKSTRRRLAWSWAGVGAVLIVSLGAAFAIGFGSVFLYYATR